MHSYGNRRQSLSGLLVKPEHKREWCHSQSCFAMVRYFGGTGGSEEVIHAKDQRGSASEMETDLIGGYYESSGRPPVFQYRKGKSNN